MSLFYRSSREQDGACRTWSREYINWLHRASGQEGTSNNCRHTRLPKSPDFRASCRLKGGHLRRKAAVEPGRNGKEYDDWYTPVPAPTPVHTRFCERPTCFVSFGNNSSSAAHQQAVHNSRCVPAIPNSQIRSLCRIVRHLPTFTLVQSATVTGQLTKASSNTKLSSIISNARSVRQKGWTRLMPRRGSNLELQTKIPCELEVRVFRSIRSVWSRQVGPRQSMAKFAVQ